jgi:hypothetical protein
VIIIQRQNVSSTTHIKILYAWREHDILISKVVSYSSKITQQILNIFGGERLKISAYHNNTLTWCSNWTSSNFNKTISSYNWYMTVYNSFMNDRVYWLISTVQHPQYKHKHILFHSLYYNWTHTDPDNILISRGRNHVSFLLHFTFFLFLLWVKGWSIECTVYCYCLVSY